MFSCISEALHWKLPIDSVHYEESEASEPINNFCVAVLFPNSPICAINYLVEVGIYTAICRKSHHPTLVHTLYQIASKVLPALYTAVLHVRTTHPTPSVKRKLRPGAWLPHENSMCASSLLWPWLSCRCAWRSTFTLWSTRSPLSVSWSRSSWRWRQLTNWVRCL